MFLECRFDWLFGSIGINHFTRLPVHDCQFVRPARSRLLYASCTRSLDVIINLQFGSRCHRTSSRCALSASTRVHPTPKAIGWHSRARSFIHAARKLRTYTAPQCVRLRPDPAGGGCCCCSCQERAPEKLSLVFRCNYPDTQPHQPRMWKCGGHYRVVALNLSRKWVCDNTRNVRDCLRYCEQIF